VAKGLLSQPTNEKPYINLSDRTFLLSVVDRLYKTAFFANDAKEQKLEFDQQTLLTNLDRYTEVMASVEVRTLPEIFAMRAWALLFVLKQENILPPVFVMSCDAPDPTTEPKADDRWFQVSWPTKLISANLNCEGAWRLSQNSNSWMLAATQEDHDTALSLLVTPLKRTT
jgi:hypothetical protein